MYGHKTVWASQYGFAAGAGEGRSNTDTQQTTPGGWVFNHRCAASGNIRKMNCTEALPEKYGRGKGEGRIWKGLHLKQLPC